MKSRKRHCYFTLLFYTVAVLITVSTDCHAQEITSASSNRDSLLLAAKEIMNSQKYCALVTTDSSGNVNMRTMNPFPPEDDMNVWMATNSQSRKVPEIKNNSKVVLYYANHAQAIGYVVVSGKAVLVDDMAEKMKRKRDYWTQAFPDWKYLMLIKVVPEKIEVVNYRRGIFGGPDGGPPPSIKF